MLWMLALAMLLAGPVAPCPLSAQGRTMLGLRGGAGVGTAGEAVYVGQIELVDMDRGGSVELAVSGWSGVRRAEDRQSRVHSFVYDYHEEMRVWGFGVLASYLWAPLRRNTGPYVALGLGVGPIWVDWRTDSTDPRFGSPAPGGGTFRAEEGVSIGSLLSVGLGQRLHERLDLRAQVLSLLVPSTTVRERAELVPLLTLTAGVGL
jgi:hypothetical protein